MDGEPPQDSRKPTNRHQRREGVEPVERLAHRGHHLAANSRGMALSLASTMIAGSLGALVAQQFDGTALPTAVGCSALGLGALLIVTITERGRLFASRRR